MTEIKYIFEMENGDRVVAPLPRPIWWKDSTARERRAQEKLALHSDPVEFALGAGRRIVNVVRPRCECVVQQVEHRDPDWAGANGTCRRCHGPLPRKGKRRNYRD